MWLTQTLDAAPAGDLDGVPARTTQAGSALTLGRFPLVAVITGIGLGICSLTDALSRATLAPSTWLLWLGVAVIVAPIVYRMCAEEASVGERAALLCLLGLSLYAVKLMRDPFGYTMPDEFFHAFNANQIASHHHLFGANSLLPVTSRYPGLEGATSALMSLTGMSSFGAGLIVIGAARLTLMLGLLLLFYAICGSWRIAGLGSVLYVANSNFLLWGAQFSYESLALPLLVVVLVAIARRARPPESQTRAWSLAIVIVIAAIVTTHHLTSYVLDAIAILFAAAPWLARGRVKTLKLWPFALIAVVLTVGWLIVVASETIGYISPVVTRAIDQTLSTIIGESAPRAPFAGLGTSIPERIVAYAGLALLLAALPYGLLAIWGRHRRDPFAVLFCLAALGFFAVLPLRFAPSAWTIANRTGEFLFIGLGFVVAYAVVDRLLPAQQHRWGPALIAISSVVVVVGGAITGWPTDSVLAAPTKVVAGGHEVDSETLAIGNWVRDHLRGARFAAPEADARTILLLGDGRPITGPTADIETTLTSTTLSSRELSLLRAHKVRYVVVDRRVRGDDNARGYGFSVRRAGGTPDRLRSVEVAGKFDQLPAPRIYDSGEVYVYDLQGVQ